MLKFIRRIFNTAVIGIMCLLIGSTFTMTAFAASPGDVGVWADTTSLPQSLAFTNSVTYGGYAYVIGGDKVSSIVDTVYYAPLNLNGTVGGTWAATTPLPKELSGSTSVVYNGYVYVMGGANIGPITVKTVYSAPLNPNGTVGVWATSVNTLPQTINGSTSIAYDGYIYVMGGYNGTALSTVYSAPVNDGTVGVWATSANTLPQTLRYASAITYNGYAYVIGGNDGGAGYSDVVYSTPLGSDGTIGTWATSPNTLPQALSGHSAVSYNGYVYVIGGNASGPYSDNIYSAPLGASGAIGTWATSPNKLPQKLQYASAITYNGYAYSIGGNASVVGNIDDVYYAKLTGLPPPPSPGQPAPVAAPNTGFSQTSYLPAALVVVAGASLVIIARRRYS